MSRDTTYSSSAILCQAFIKKITIFLLTHFQPHRIIIILFDVFYLKQANLFSVIHHRQTPKPTERIHTQSRDVFRTSNKNTCCTRFFVHLFITSIRESITILHHKLQLVL